MPFVVISITSGWLPSWHLRVWFLHMRLCLLRGTNGVFEYDIRIISSLKGRAKTRADSRRRLMGKALFRSQAIPFEMCDGRSAPGTCYNPTTRVVPKVMSNFFFACELGTADEGECGGRWNQLLCYP